MGISIPTSARFMNLKEYEIVSGVFGDTLPYRRRILITNGAGVDGRAFTIPTSLVSTLLGTAATGYIGLISGYLTSFINAGYLINVGSKYDKLADTEKDLLVHETAHIWQGKNSKMALTYVFNSCLDQCLFGNGAYNFTPGKDWTSYGVEQQASIVEEWFAKGSQESDKLFPYIRDYVRKGIA